MRAAIVSDIHGNRQALEAVLEAIDASAPELIWCLGDIVGYGADPEACVEIIRRRATICLAGNHDLGVTGALDLSDFSQDARTAAEWTRAQISEGARAYLNALAPMYEEATVGLYHGSPRDPVWEYVVSSWLADLCLDFQPRRVCLTGHSHLALSFWRPEGGAATGERRVGGDVLDISGGEWLLNPGSVGQPRDGDPRASWLELDLDRWTASFHRTEYDIAGAAAAILSAGLPELLAKRLSYGQ
ncbi:MAG: metallophosphoesterase family protein [Solirubrobacteraceae bacterium]